MLIDSHVHIFPEIVKNHRENYFYDDNFRLLYNSEKSKIISYQEADAYMKQEKTDMICALGFSWKSIDMARIHNKYIMECAEKNNDIIPFASIPSSPVNSVEEYISEIKSAGFRGIGELAFYTEPFNNELWQYIDEIFASCMKNSLIIVMHLNEPAGHEYPGKYNTDFGRLSGFIMKYPELKIVLSHCGGGIFIYELMPEIKKAFKNVYYDTAATPYIYDNRIFKQIAEIVGADKILFGTDYPLIGTEKYIAAMKQAGLSNEAIEQLCFKNIERLLNLK